MDIHTGGVDLKFPHHDNELAQAEVITFLTSHELQYLILSKFYNFTNFYEVKLRQLQIVHLTGG